MNEKEQNLQELVESLRKSGEEMGAEITHLRRAIAGQKGRIVQLQKEVDRYKALDKEGDELNEIRIAKIDSLRNILTEKENIISELQDQTKEMASRLSNMERKLTEAVAQRDEWQKEYLELSSRPWYKRIFVK